MQIQISDVGQAIVALDQEYHRMQEQANEARRQAAMFNIREKYCIDRMREVESAIEKLRGWRYES